MIAEYFRKDLEAKVAALEKEIEELNRDNEKLRKRLSKREEKVSLEPEKIQRMSEELKRERTKSESLMDKLSNMNAAEETGISIRDQHYLSRKNTLEFLDRISCMRSVPGSKQLMSVYVACGDGMPDLQIDPGLMKYLDRLYSGSGTGLIAFIDTCSPSVLTAAAVPPFSPEKSSVSYDDLFDCDSLRRLLLKTRHIAFADGHAGESFIGMFTESEVLYSDVVRSSVIEKHSKGGWSQKRFEKLRNEDIKHHTDKAGGEFSGMYGEFSGAVDGIVIAGEKKTASDIIGDVSDSEIPVVYRQLETLPEKHAGERYLKELWSCRWYLF